MKKLLMKFVKDEKGINTVEIVVLVAIAIGLALIFRDQITSFLQSIFEKIFNPDAIIPTTPTTTPQARNINMIDELHNKLNDYLSNLSVQTRTQKCYSLTYIKTYTKACVRTCTGKGCKGAVTIEYALVFPVVIICVAILVYVGLIYYQQALLHSVISENAQNYALLWGYDLGELNTGEGITNADTYLSEGLYWQVFSQSEKKKLALQKSIKNEIEKRSILEPSREIEVEVIYRTYFILQKVGLKANMTYKLPADKFLKSLELSGEIQICSYSEITVNDPKEFIHNVDYLLQIYEESGASTWVNEKCKPLIDSLSKIKAFFK